MQSHAAVPFAEHAGGDLFTVYFSARDAAQRSHTGRLTLELGSMPRVLDVDPQPVLSPGALGCFDDSGAMLSWIVKAGQQRRFYYIGWNRGVTVPFRNSVGLAIAQDDKPPVRYAEGPILDRSASEPHFVASVCVLPDGERWRLWYLSCVGWDIINGAPRHRYHIKYAESADGIVFDRRGVVALDFAGPSEYAISRPSVLRGSDRWRMWYSYRGTSYRIGYAESDDGRAWRRQDGLAGIDVSADGWDSEMIEYPFVFLHRGQHFMLYNGNDYGRTGFGLAVLDT